jgi:hypothetical protein
VRTSALARFVARFRARLSGPVCLGLAVVLMAGCGSAETELVAREREAPMTPPPTSTQRERVQVVDGQLLSDLGTPLRGLLLPVDVGWTLGDLSLLTNIADSGFNAVHVYLENSTQISGEMQAEGDALVALTAQAGLYLVLGIGGGSANGTFSLEKVRSFWQLYAARYGSQTHVLFEVQNNPEIGCAEPLSAKTVAMEREAYALIRQRAPDSHVLLFSTSSVPELPVIERAVDDVADVIDFQNESFAMHTDPTCLPAGQLGDVTELLGARQVPLLISQLPDTRWQPVLARAEELGVGWLHHYWLAEDAELATLKGALDEASLSWCPDRGRFPQSAEECRR